jgi:hypothetical protein
MTTVRIHAEIDADGKLRLDVPVGLPPGNAEVLVVVQPEVANGNGVHSGRTGSSRSGLFGGSTEKNLDVDAALKEMNEAWKAKLSDPSRTSSSPTLTQFIGTSFTIRNSRRVQSKYSRMQRRGTPY